MTRTVSLAGFFALTLACACAGSPSAPLPRGLPADAGGVDLDRFMGTWYVVAHLPTRTERDAYDAIEEYALRDDGEIDVRFRFCDGSADGPLEEVTMLGWVHEPEFRAEWRVRPFWPLTFRYQILELDPGYTTTVVGHPSGSYAWVMTREPRIDEAELAAIVERLAARGYETERLRRVPHSAANCLGRGAT